MVTNVYKADVHVGYGPELKLKSGTLPPTKAFMIHTEST